LTLTTLAYLTWFERKVVAHIQSRWGPYYVGAHGRSMRLVGLDSTNCNAEPRGIVVHAAWYVGPEMVQAHGMLGRSEGCFAVSPADLPTMLTRLGPGRLLVATRL